VYDDAGLLIQQGDSDAFVLSAGDDHTVRLNVTPLLPPAPTGVKAARTRLRPWISVTWSEASGAENYRVYRSESVDGKYQMIGDSDRPSFIDKNALRAKYYYYRVASMNAAGTSAKSKTYGSCYLKGWRFEHETVANTANGIGVRYDLLAWGYLGKPRAACVYGIFAKDGTYYYTPGSGFDGKAAFKTVYLPIHELSMWKGGGLVVYDTTFDSNYRNNQYTQYVAVKVFTSADPQKITDSSYCETRMFRFTWSVNKNGDPVMLPGDEVAADEAAVIEASLSGHEDASHEAGQVNVGTCSNGAEDVNVEAP